MVPRQGFMKSALRVRAELIAALYKVYASTSTELQADVSTSVQLIGCRCPLGVTKWEMVRPEKSVHDRWRAVNYSGHRCWRAGSATRKYKGCNLEVTTW
jgi:hypothetical protein